MLVLSRFEKESVIIDGKIRVTVLSFRKSKKHGFKVSLGFVADPSISIQREEIQIDIDRNGRRGDCGTNDGGKP